MIELLRLGGSCRACDHAVLVFLGSCFSLRLTPSVVSRLTWYTLISKHNLLDRDITKLLYTARKHQPLLVQRICQALLLAHWDTFQGKS